jgi:CheY-like chemotaxis protein
MAKSKNKSANYVSLDIFIVDDSPWHNIFLSNLLEYKGHRVTAFDNGYMLLNHLENEKPDLIISDIEMPAINGLDLYKEVREKEEGTNIPFFFVSSFQEEGALENIDTFNSGFFLKKHLKKELLMREISETAVKK